MKIVLLTKYKLTYQQRILGLVIVLEDTHQDGVRDAGVCPTHQETVMRVGLQIVSDSPHSVLVVRQEDIAVMEVLEMIEIGPRDDARHVVCSEEVTSCRILEDG